ncbi:uncharacterized protein JCM6883_000226 [Sporobolomyces salmoneus]|uniref:uncharacterized protein n=1 Tax=Sporobolomyces salmoneus TaxID=183962 RepID=UPI00316D3D37
MEDESNAQPSTPPSLSPPPLRDASVIQQALPKYTPYRFDAPPIPFLLTRSFSREIKPSESMSTASDTRGGAGPLLLAALESMKEEPEGLEQQPGESSSLSPNNYSNHSSEGRTSETSVSGSRDQENASASESDSVGYKPQGSNSAYSHPAYNSLQHPLYSRPVAPTSSNYSSSSSFALPPINRASYTPYNYQSSYSRPLSSSGGASSSSTGNTFQTSGTSNSTTLPPLNMAVFSTNPSSSDPSSSSAYRSLSSPTTNPSNYAQTSSSSNPYNHPAYGNASSHTFQHPAYARASASTSTSIGFAPPPPPPPASASSSTNPYSHPALPPPSGSSMNLSTSTSSSNSSPWAGPPPPPLSMSSGSLLAKRRRSETAGPTLQSLKSSTRSKESEFEEKDEIEEEGEDSDKEEKRESTSLKRSTEEREEEKQSDDEEEREQGRQPEDESDGEEMAPQIQPASTATTRPTKRARTTSAKSDTSKPSRSRATTSGTRPPAPRKKSPKGRVYTVKGNEPPEKKFVCPHPSCGRAFARHFNLNSHIKSHQGIREFKCPECNKLFSRKHDCTRHCIAIHNYDRESGSKGPIHEPASVARIPNRTSQQPLSPAPAPNSPPPVSRPLPPAELLLHASGTSTGGQSARQSLAMLLRQQSEDTAAADSTSTTDANDSSTSSSSTAAS